MQHPDRVIRLAILNVPHPAVLQHNIPPTRSLVLSNRPGTSAAKDLARHAEAWSYPGSMTAMLNLCRILLVRA